MKLWRRMIYALERRSRRKNLIIIHVPYYQYGNADGVAALGRHLGHAPRQRIIRLEHWCAHLRDVLVLPSQPTSAIAVLFAHPAPQNTGFAVNPAPRNVREVLLLSWWQDPKVSFEVLVAHVCNGTSILDSPAWRAVFPHWVSYDRWITGIYEGAGGARWSRIATATVETGLDGGSMREVANRLKFAYLREMKDIEETGNPVDGDAFNFMQFQNALDALRTSEDAL
jgi:hypothetical protein